MGETTTDDPTSKKKDSHEQVKSFLRLCSLSFDNTLARWGETLGSKVVEDILMYKVFGNVGNLRH